MYARKRPEGISKKKKKIKKHMKHILLTSLLLLLLLRVYAVSLLWKARAIVCRPCLNEKKNNKKIHLKNLEYF